MSGSCTWPSFVAGKLFTVWTTEFQLCANEPEQLSPMTLPLACQMACKTQHLRYLSRNGVSWMLDHTRLLFPKQSSAHQGC